jgi:hypothetical protein
MKRSEIVAEITNILDAEAEDLCYPFLAELILTTLENKGMLPPSIFTGNHIIHNDGSESNEYLNDWEPEDD